MIREKRARREERPRVRRNCGSESGLRRRGGKVETGARREGEGAAAGARGTERDGGRQDKKR